MNMKQHLILLLVGLTSSCLQVTQEPTPVDINKSAARWYKGNLHTHTLWSDGDAPPEVIVSWYKDHGYDFLTLSDHNILSVGEKWIPASKNNFNLEKLERLKTQFGDNSVQLRSENDSLFMRLKTLELFSQLFKSLQTHEKGIVL
jgi:hypothetical protein